MSQETSTPIPDPLPEDVPALHALVRALQAEIAALRTQVEILSARLGQDSHNSSRPPSSDPPWRSRPPKPPSGKKRGAQPGHPGRSRPWAPPETVTHHQDVVPDSCTHCGQTFAPGPPRRPRFRRHQVVELPPIQLEILEYRLHARDCPHCRRRTWAALPPGVSRRCVGPRIQALVALLSGACRLARRTVQRLLADLCGLHLSLGTLSALEGDTARALETPYREVAQAVTAAAVLHVDETSWREAGQLQWLWTAVGRQFAFYRVDRRRNRAALAGLLGLEDPEDLPAGVLHTDRYSAYGHLPAEQRSFCWAHLIREFQAMYERGGIDGVVGSWLLDGAAHILGLWHTFREGTQTREAFLAALSVAQTEFRIPLGWGQEKGTAATQTLCRDLLQRWEYLWTWARVEGGEPTNNRAERALRAAVQWRKSSFGHQAERGRHYVERMLTVGGTLALQGRSLWEYLVAACEAAVAGRPAPSLLAVPAGAGPAGAAGGGAAPHRLQAPT